MSVKQIKQRKSTKEGRLPAGVFALAAILPALTQVYLIFGDMSREVRVFRLIIWVIALLGVWVVSSGRAVRVRRERGGQTRGVMLAFGMVVSFLVYQFAVSYAYRYFGFDDLFYVFNIFGPVFVLYSAIWAKARYEIGESDKFVSSVLWALPILVALNVIGWAIGIHGTSTASAVEVTSARLLGVFGVHLSRVMFPFSMGVNAFGIVSGAAIVSAGGLYFISKGWQKAIAILLLLPTTLAATLMVDSRGALGAAVICLIIVFVGGRLNLTRWWAALFSAPFLAPIALMSIAGILDALGLVALISRDSAVDAGDALTSSRAIIWTAFYNFQSDFSLSHLIGYGYYGQFTSGLSAEYSSVFGSSGANLHTLHNGVMQILVDYGWVVGVSSFVLVYASGLRFASAISSGGQKQMMPIFGLLIYWWLQNSVEACTSIYRLELMGVYLSILVVGLTIVGPKARLK
jgi:O-Antigen ligase